ncbi:restriction endonuclease [Brachyspira pilosicoli]|uniref:tetratricopeptide repeat protein n=1 Tax=Brachyspira pilosicoli TaxID=52584 RepID=UPI003006B8EC
MEIIYLYALIILGLLFATLVLLKTVILKKDKVKKPKALKKRIEELNKRLKQNQHDYDAIYQLANIEEEFGSKEKAVSMYKILLDENFFNSKEKIEMYKKLELICEELGDIEQAFKYTLIINKEEPENKYYYTKVAHTLVEEGYYKLAYEYYHRALVLKSEFSIEDFKYAAFASFQVKDYKKTIIYLEKLYKKMCKDINQYKLDIAKLMQSLVSIYILSDEINIAKTFIEEAFIYKAIDSDNRLYMNKIYLFILYKLDDNKKFTEIYNKLIDMYKINNDSIDIADLIFDYGFYSYFLKDIKSAINYFNIIKSFNIELYNVFNIDNILEYLRNVEIANSQLTKLYEEKKIYDSKYKNDNFENYIKKEYIDNWEKAISLWESSFIHLDYISNLVETKKTMNIEEVLKEFKLYDIVNHNVQEYQKTSAPSNKIDKIFNLSFSDFKKICQNIISSKLSYTIVQEYIDSADKIKGDEIDYLAYNNKMARVELTLISFRRWKKIDIGELSIRDFFMKVQESGAKNGILIVPAELTKSARSYVSHNESITVYSKHQFNNLLKGEIF